MKSLIANMSRLQQIEKGWWLLPQVVGLLLLVSFILPVVGFQRVSRWFGLMAGEAEAPYDSRLLHRARHIAVLVNAVAARLPLPFTCLARSLVLWRLLRSTGIDCQLYIGVNHAQKVHDSLAAHAWIEYYGNILNDRPDVHATYTTLATFIARKKASH